MPPCRGITSGSHVRLQLSIQCPTPFVRSTGSSWCFDSVLEGLDRIRRDDSVEIRGPFAQAAVDVHATRISPWLRVLGHSKFLLGSPAIVREPIVKAGEIGEA